MMPPAMRLFALRGAASVEHDEGPAILAATTALLEEILERNALTPDDVVSCIFTSTSDLTAEYPAVAARAMGFNSVPLLCAQELAVPGSLGRVVRLLMHFHAAEDHEVRHVYQGEAKKLRLDISGAQ